MTAKKTPEATLGNVWDLGTTDVVEVMRPDGSTVRAGGGSHILDQVGTYTAGDLSVEVKPPADVTVQADPTP